jgi:hypothetical protein
VDAASSVTELGGLGIPYPDKGVIDLAPASDWEHSMVSGNGTLGVLVPGHPTAERLTFGHERLFLPLEEKREPLRLASLRQQIATLLAKGRTEDASALFWKQAVEEDFTQLIWTDPLVPAVSLSIEFPEKPDSACYLRTTNFRTGEVLVAYGTEHFSIKREIFVSRAHDVAVLRLTSSSGAFRCRMKLETPPVEPRAQERFDACVDRSESNASDGWLTHATVFKKQWDCGLSGHASAARVVTQGGTTVCTDGWMSIEDAREVVVLLAVKLSRVPQEPDPQPIKAYLQNLTCNYDALLREHVSIHQPLYDRCELRLTEPENGPVTSKDILSMADEAEHVRPAVAEKLFAAARYNMISSTGELPPTLQGIWGALWRPRFSSDFTMDGNVQAAIAAALSTNVPEAILALCNYLESLMDDFRTNARVLHGCGGIMVPARTSTHGLALHFSQGWPLVYWVAGAGWLAWFFYDYWLYTQDRDFLIKHALPFMLEAAEFYEDYLSCDANGEVIVTPSYSPENTPLHAELPLCMNATMDIAVVRELFSSLITLSETEMLPAERVERWKRLQEGLPPYEVAEDGTFREWLHGLYSENHEHRHASHLYPLFHVPDRGVLGDKSLNAACSESIERRLNYRHDTSGVMAFGLVQLGLAATNLRDKGHAQDCLDQLCKGHYWTRALVSFHHPNDMFNVDISGGLPAVIAQMLLLSTADEIELLPLLPEGWSEGSIIGLRARGGVSVDLVWQSGFLKEALVTSRLERDLKIRYRDDTVTLAFRPGETIDVSGHFTMNSASG